MVRIIAVYKPSLLLIINMHDTVFYSYLFKNHFFFSGLLYTLEESDWRKSRKEKQIYINIIYWNVWTNTFFLQYFFYIIYHVHSILCVCVCKPRGTWHWFYQCQLVTKYWLICVVKGEWTILICWYLNIFLESVTASLW